ncbi:hypothetical protein IH601_04455 [Candidatus Bipolaricaulota bacterium]|nr:hypothetical protein [Candidatus Bipolaricaulota bacterium]TFH07326.1 MAG: hypothetical protein E4H08_09670 [Candidatus Atribacteria bacterium]
MSSSDSCELRYASLEVQTPFVEDLARLITAGAWGLVALTLAAGIPFVWRKILAYIEAKTQLSLAEAVRRMLDE